MERETSSSANEKTLKSDLGTFEGFNFRSQSAIERILTAEEVINWDHDRKGEAEFWPSGDCAGVALIFQSRSAVTGSELLDLDRLLDELGGDTTENFLRIYYAVNTRRDSLAGLTAAQVEDHNLSLFVGTSFIDLRRDAAFELFELYYPEEYRVCEKSTCDGLIFDEDRFLDSPSFSVEEVIIGEQKALLVVPQ